MGSIEYTGWLIIAFCFLGIVTAFLIAFAVICHLFDVIEVVLDWDDKSKR